MANIFRKSKRIMILLVVVVVFSMLLVQLQINLTQVSAQVIPVQVSTHGLAFGTVFPGENLSKNLIVTYDEVGDGVNYRIIQKIKPLPDAVVPESYEGTIREYCQEYKDDYDRCYRNLCPYLEKVSLEGEEDEEGADGSAFVGPDDLSDTWTIYFAVPAIFGHIAQDHIGGVVGANGEYGCDISIDVEAGCEVGTLWQIGDVEASQLDNPVDELNWPGAFGIFPSFPDPFILGTNTDNEFPYNSNFSNGYAINFDVNFNFDSFVNAGAQLIIGWGPGGSGSEQKEVLLDSVSLGTTPVRVGSSQAGWWEEMERFQDSFNFTLTPGAHTLKFKHLFGNGTIWDFVRLEILECQANSNSSGNGFTIASSGSSSGSGFYNYENQGSGDGITVLGEAGAPNLSASKSVLSDFANVGETGVGYQIDITNNGNMTAFGVTVNYSLPDGMVFNGTEDDFQSWVIGDIGPGETKTVNYTVDILNTANPDLYTNMVVIAASNHDPISASADLEVRGVAVLGLGGGELEPTGFSIKEFIILSGLLVALATSVIILRRKYI